LRTSYSASETLSALRSKVSKNSDTTKATHHTKCHSYKKWLITYKVSYAESKILNRLNIKCFFFSSKLIQNIQVNISFSIMFKDIGSSWVNWHPTIWAWSPYGLIRNVISFIFFVIFIINKYRKLYFFIPIKSVWSVNFYSISDILLKKQFKVTKVICRYFLFLFAFHRI
jgi:hypothetical protein